MAITVKFLQGPPPLRLQLKAYPLAPVDAEKTATPLKPFAPSSVWVPMVLTSPTFRIEILPNALVARPDLFEGLDSVLPALDVQLEESWPGLHGAPTEVLVTANVEQAILDPRAIFLVSPNPEPKLLSGLIDTGRAMRWIPKETDRGTWVDGFARFLLAQRISERTQAKSESTRYSQKLLGNLSGRQAK